MAHTSEERDTTLEQRLDRLLGSSLTPQNRQDFDGLISELNQTTPVATYARAKSHEALILAIDEGLINEGIALIEHEMERSIIASSSIANAELLHAKAEILLKYQDRDAIASLLPKLIAQFPVEESRLNYHRLHIIGRSYDLIHDFESALDYFLQAHDSLKTTDNAYFQNQRQLINLHIGRTYARLRNFTRARKVLDDAINDSYLHGIEEHLPSLYMVRGFVIQVTEGPNENAEADFLKAARAPVSQPSGRTQMLAFNNLGTLHLHTGNYAQAESYFEKGIKIAKAINNSYELYIMRFNQGYVLVKQGEENSGLEIMESAFSEFSQVAPLGTQADMLEYLADAYKIAGNTEGELATVKKTLALRTESFQHERERIVAELEVRHDAQEADLRIKLLEQDALIQKALLVEQERRQQIFYLIVFGSFVGFLAALLGIRHVRKLNRELYNANQNLQELSSRDPLTKVFNRRALNDFSKERGDLVILLDLDKFKQINDSFGHDTGDTVLKSISQRLRAVLRSEDLVVRWGGEEFLVVIRRASKTDFELIKAKLRDAIVHSPIEGVEVNASGGGVHVKDPSQTWEEVVSLADNLLYKAKASGRGQIHVEVDGQRQKWLMTEN